MKTAKFNNQIANAGDTIQIIHGRAGEWYSNCVGHQFMVHRCFPDVVQIFNETDSTVSNDDVYIHPDGRRFQRYKRVFHSDYAVIK